MRELTLQLILKFLRDNDHIDAFLSLENEIPITFKSYAPEILFFRKILMKGDFTEAVQFIHTFQNKVDAETIRNFVFLLYKQKLYELLENPDSNELRNIFENQIVHVCSEDEYRHLFTLLTCRSVKEIEGLEKWSSMRGRFYCFEVISQTLQNFFPQPRLSLIEQNLEAIIDSYFKDNCPKNKANHLESRRLFSTQKQESMESRDGLSLSAFKEEPVYSSISHIKSDSFSSRDKHSIKISSNRMYESKNQIQKGDFSKKKQVNYIKLYGQPPLVEELVDENQQSIEIKNSKTLLPPAYLRGETPEGKLKDESKMNLAYLEQNNSLVMRDEENQNFTFSQHAEEECPIHYANIKIDKVTSVVDNKAIRVCEQSKSGDFLAMGNNYAQLKIYSLEQFFQENENTERCQEEIKFLGEISEIHTKPIFSIDWALNDRGVLTCSSDLSIKFTQFSENLSNREIKSTVIGYHDLPVRMVKFSSNERLIVSCADDGVLKIWDTSKQKRCTSLQGHNGSIRGFKFESKKSDFILYSVSKDCTVKMWDIRTNSCVCTAETSKSEMTYISDNSQKIVVSHRNGSVSFFNNRTLKMEHNLQIHQQEIRALDYCPSDSLYLTASFDGNLSLFNETHMDHSVYFQNNEIEEDKVVYCTFLKGLSKRYFATTSVLGYCNIFSYH